MANNNMQGKQSAPRYASIMGQPHMLAYINEDEERMIREAGGAGTPGPGGVPAYWTITEPSTWGNGAGYEGVGNFNASDNNSSSSGSSGGRNMDADNFAGSNYVATANTGNEGSGTNSDGVGVRLDSDLAGYIHTSNSYSNSTGGNFIPDDELAFYTDNPNTTITADMYERGKAISKVFGKLTGPLLGLGTRAMVELQKRGMLPGVDAQTYFESNDIPEITGSASEDRIMQMIEDGATNEEIQDEINKVGAEQDLANKTLALDAMSDAAYGDSTNADVAANPENYFSDTYLTDRTPDIDPEAAGTNISKEDYQLTDQDDVALSTVQNTATADDIAAKTAEGYNVREVDASLSSPQYTAEGQTGTVGPDALVDASANTINVEDTEKGLNAVGRALNEFAAVDTSRVIDTSTVAGKLLADKLGEGNYVDSKSTILGQMDIISAEFKNSAGEPIIPAWAQATARNIQKTIAFSGMTGTAATAALSNAMMESTLGIAEKEASFFQTLAIENLSNQQEALIQKASVLSNFELSNLDARMTAAVQNAKSFLQMDLANLDNDQQAEILNIQNRVDGLLLDAKAVNAERLFSAEQTNDFAKFYDELAYQIDKHQADSVNEMSRFNVGETNDNSEFQASLDLNREKFYKDLQYNIDLSNAKWRQSVTLAEAEMEFNAARTDAENMFSLTSESLNRTWDREDAYFDYIWKSSETELERSVDLYEIDKEYETEMLKINNAVAAAEGAADYELFKLGLDVIDSDIWDMFG